MLSLLTSSYNNTAKIVLAAITYTLVACNAQSVSPVSISPKHFKVKTPFMLDKRGIIINTYWGSDRKHHVLCIDTYSPSWIKSSVIQYSESFVKSKNVSFKSSTADGSPIQGDVGVCDSVLFENILFRNIPFYVMPDKLKNNQGDDGVFGIDAMSKGVWKIDFRNSKLTFASSIDSFSEINQAEILPATFNRYSITVDVDFGNNNVKKMAIDLGYNDYMLMPITEFHKISPLKKDYLNLKNFSTPAGENVVNTLSISDTVQINRNWFFTIINSTETAKENLIGLSFFKRFDYVIFDFIDKRMYIPKKVW